MMFKEEYKNAYDEIKADDGSVNKILERASGKSAYKKKRKVWKPVIVTMLLAVTLIVSVNIPTFAQEIERMMRLWEVEGFDYTSYKSMQRNSSKMNSFLPENKIVRKDGLIMSVDLVAFRDKEFVAYLSFANEEGYDLIEKDGEYYWNSISVSIGEKVLKHGKMKFLRYDEEKEKVYYVYTANTGTSKFPEGEMVHIEVNGFYEYDRREESLGLADVALNADTRMVKILNSHVDSEFVTLEGDDFPYMASVLNCTPLSEIENDEIAVTGVAYMDGVLRIQLCKPDDILGYFSESAYIDHYNKEGKQILPNGEATLVWYEKVDGKLMEFTEEYFVLSEEEIKEIPLKVIITDKKGYFGSTWEVEFEVKNNK